MNISWNYKQLKRWRYLVVQKIGRQNKEWWKRAKSSTVSSSSSSSSSGSSNLVDTQYHQNSEVLYTFMPNKSYAYLLNVEPS